MTDLIVKIEDHIERANDRLLSQFKGKEKIEGLLAAFHAQIQDIENVGYDLYLQRWIASATGNTLDRLGAMVNVERNGASDSDYRINIIGEINTQFSSGSNDDIIITAKNITGASLVLFIEEYPATFYLDCRGVDNTSLTDIPRLKRVIEKSKPAGVKFELLITSTSDSFSFSQDSEGLGFGINEDPNVGGQFAIQI